MNFYLDGIMRILFPSIYKFKKSTRESVEKSLRAPHFTEIWKPWRTVLAIGIKFLDVKRYEEFNEIGFAARTLRHDDERS